MRGWIAATVIVGCVACGSPVTTNEQGSLAVTRASVADGLGGTYTKHGITVRFEALRGAPTGSLDPGAPAFASAARFADAEGRTIVLEGFAADASWEPVEQDSGHRAQELDLVSEATAEIARAELPPELTFERQALVALGGSVAEARQGEVAAVQAPHNAAAIACDKGYRHAIWTKYNYISGWPEKVCNGGEHSATRMCTYAVASNCAETLKYCRSSCNHGTCYGDLSLLACSWKSGLRSNYTPPYQYEDSRAWYVNDGLACWTIYPEHVCNDDSKLQMNNVMYNKSYSHAVDNPLCAPGPISCKAPRC